MTQLSKLSQLVELLGKLLWSLMKTGLPLIENGLKPLAKSVLVPLGLTPAVSATGSITQKKCFGLGMSALIISEMKSRNYEMNDIMKIIKSLEGYGLLIKVVSEIIKNEANEQKGEYLM